MNEPTTPFQITDEEAAIIQKAVETMQAIAKRIEEGTGKIVQLEYDTNPTFWGHQCVAWGCNTKTKEGHFRMSYGQSLQDAIDDVLSEERIFD